MKNKKGTFGQFGGVYVSTILEQYLNKLEQTFLNLKNNSQFISELNYYLKNFIGRPSPLFLAKNISKKLGNIKIYLKREDLNHTGSHKINNTIGQILLAKHMKSKRIIAETGAGQHGVATATAAALFNIPCTIYMGKKDSLKQPLNVQKIKTLGAEIKIIENKNQNLKSAIDSAFNDLTENYKTTFYIIGSAVGPHPYPTIVKFFQSIIGNEIKKQLLKIENRLPDYLIACVGGGSNSIGAFNAFINNKKTKLIGVEASGLGICTNYHAAPLNNGKINILHGCKTYVISNNNIEIKNSYSIASGLDYPGVGPEHCYLKELKLVKYVTVTDDEALHAFTKLSKLEGIIPAIESAHALAYAMKIAPDLPKNTIVVVNLSGRGDKDINTLLNLKKVTNKI